MFPDAPRRRLPKLFPLVFLLVSALALTACGQDLGKSNFARTTVPATAATGQPADGPITDTAVAAEVLRLVKPCPLLSKDALGALGLGTVQDDPSPSSVNFDTCGNTVKDPGGKEIKIQLAVGTTSLPIGRTETGTVGGLPLETGKSGGTGDCDIAALTARNPDLGVTLSVNYTNGDACRAANTVLEAVVAKLHNSPEKYEVAQGTLLNVDPCASADTASVQASVKDAKPSLESMHSCSWKAGAGTNPSVTVDFRPGLPPVEGDGYQKADLGSGVTAYKKQGTTSTSACAVEWKHRTWQDDQVELAQVRYENYDAKPDADDPCGKAVAVAENVVSKLPKA